MSMSTDRVISTLNDLIETCKDGERGFQMAAENINDRELMALFNSYSHQRAQFAEELQTEVRRLGGDPEQRGSVGGALHRGWINIKAAITSHNPAQIIEECERGEDVAVSSYREALDQDLPDELGAFVRRQYDQVLDAHDHVRALERDNLRYRMDKPSFNQ